MRADETPKKIYLQINDSETEEELEDNEITWCEHRQHKTDIEYVRKERKK